MKVKPSGTPVPCIDRYKEDRRGSGRVLAASGQVWSGGAVPDIVEPVRSIRAVLRDGQWWAEILDAEGTSTELGPFDDMVDALRAARVRVPHFDARARPSSSTVTTSSTSSLMASGGSGSFGWGPWIPEIEGLPTFALGWYDQHWGWGAQAGDPTNTDFRCVGVTAHDAVDCYQGHRRVAAGTTSDQPGVVASWCAGADIATVHEMFSGPPVHDDDDMRPEVYLNWERYAAADTIEYRPDDRRVLAALRDDLRLSRYYVYVGLRGIDLSSFSGPGGDFASWARIGVPWPQQPDDSASGLLSHLHLALMKWTVGQGFERAETEERLRRVEDEALDALRDRDPADTFAVQFGGGKPEVVSFEALMAECQANMPTGQTGAIPATPALLGPR